MNCIINILDKLLILCNDCNAMKSHVIHDRELLYNHLGGGGGGGGGYAEPSKLIRGVINSKMEFAKVSKLKELIIE